MERSESGGGGGTPPRFQPYPSDGSPGTDHSPSARSAAARSTDMARRCYWEMRNGMCGAKMLRARMLHEHLWLTWAQSGRRPEALAFQPRQRILRMPLRLFAAIGGIPCSMEDTPDWRRLRILDLSEEQREEAGCAGFPRTGGPLESSPRRRAAGVHRVLATFDILFRLGLLRETPMPAMQELGHAAAVSPTPPRRRAVHRGRDNSPTNSESSPTAAEEGQQRASARVLADLSCALAEIGSVRQFVHPGALHPSDADVDFAGCGEVEPLRRALARYWETLQTVALDGTLGDPEAVARALGPGVFSLSSWTPGEARFAAPAMQRLGEFQAGNPVPSFEQVRAVAAELGLSCGLVAEHIFSRLRALPTNAVISAIGFSRPRPTRSPAAAHNPSGTPEPGLRRRQIFPSSRKRSREATPAPPPPQQQQQQQQQQQPQQREQGADPPAAAGAEAEAPVQPRPKLSRKHWMSAQDAIAVVKAIVGAETARAQATGESGGEVFACSRYHGSVQVRNTEAIAAALGWSREQFRRRWSALQRQGSIRALLELASLHVAHNRHRGLPPEQGLDEALRQYYRPTVAAGARLPGTLLDCHRQWHVSRGLQWKRAPQRRVDYCPANDTLGPVGRPTPSYVGDPVMVAAAEGLKMINICPDAEYESRDGKLLMRPFVAPPRPIHWRAVPYSPPRSLLPKALAYLETPGPRQVLCKARRLLHAGRAFQLSIDAEQCLEARVRGRVHFAAACELAAKTRGTGFPETRLPTALADGQLAAAVDAVACGAELRTGAAWLGAGPMQQQLLSRSSATAGHLLRSFFQMGSNRFRRGQPVYYLPGGVTLRWPAHTSPGAEGRGPSGALAREEQQLSGRSSPRAPRRRVGEVRAAAAAARRRVAADAERRARRAQLQALGPLCDDAPPPAAAPPPRFWQPPACGCPAEPLLAAAAAAAAPPPAPRSQRAKVAAAISELLVPGALPPGALPVSLQRSLDQGDGVAEGLLRGAALHLLAALEGAVRSSAEEGSRGGGAPTRPALSEAEALRCVAEAAPPGVPLRAVAALLQAAGALLRLSGLAAEVPGFLPGRLLCAASAAELCLFPAEMMRRETARNAAALSAAAAAAVRAAPPRAALAAALVCMHCGAVGAAQQRAGGIPGLPQGTVTRLVPTASHPCEGVGGLLGRKAPELRLGKTLPDSATSQRKVSAQRQWQGSQRRGVDPRYRRDFEQLAAEEACEEAVLSPMDCVPAAGRPLSVLTTLRGTLHRPLLRRLLLAVYDHVAASPGASAEEIADSFPLATPRTVHELLALLVSEGLLSATPSVGPPDPPQLAAPGAAPAAQSVERCFWPVAGALWQMELDPPLRPRSTASPGSPRPGVGAG